MSFIWTPEKKKPFSFLINYANFLDFKISLGNGAIHTELCNKPTDSHQYLHYQLSHAQHTKVSIPYSQARRVSRIYSSEKDFKALTDRMRPWFLCKYYPEQVVKDQIDNFVFSKSPPIKS